MKKIVLSILSLIILLIIIASCDREIPEDKPYSVKYYGNGATGGVVPSDSMSYSSKDSVYIKANLGNLVNNTLPFVGWNTKADGTGTVLIPETYYPIGSSNLSLYATWNLWTYVGNKAFTSGVANYPVLSIYNGTPYIAFQDSANNSKTTVMKYNGTNWDYVGLPGFSTGGFNSFAIDNGILYIASINNYKITVMKFDGTSWINVGNSDFSIGTASFLPHAKSLSVENGILYVAYKDINLSNNNVIVMKFDGSNWVSVGNPGITCQSSTEPSIAVNNGIPFIAYNNIATNKVIVMKYDGANWNTVGNLINVANLNNGYGSTYANPLIVFDNTTPYVAFIDYAPTAKASVMKYDGTNWVSVGSLGFTLGTAYKLSLTIYNGTPYVGYSNYPYSKQASVMKYDGINWVKVGNLGFSQGSSDYVTIAIYNNIVYAAYQDTPNGSKASVMKY